MPFTAINTNIIIFIFQKSPLLNILTTQYLIILIFVDPFTTPHYPLRTQRPPSPKSGGHDTPNPQDRRLCMTKTTLTLACTARCALHIFKYDTMCVTDTNRTGPGGVNL